MCPSFHGPTKCSRVNFMAAWNHSQNVNVRFSSGSLQNFDFVTCGSASALGDPSNNFSTNENKNKIIEQNTKKQTIVKSH